MALDNGSDPPIKQTVSPNGTDMHINATAADTGFDAAAYKLQVSAGYHSMPETFSVRDTNLIKSQGKDQVSQSERSDPLRRALEIAAKIGAPTSSPLSPADSVHYANVEKAAQSKVEDEARNRLAQEALAANPGEIRKLFPKLLKDIHSTYGYIDFSKHLDMKEIDLALANKKLPQEDHNLLVVLKAGYNVLSEFQPGLGPGDNFLLPDQDGISASSLALIDKAVNRGIHEDPYLRQSLSYEPMNGFVYLGMAGAGIGGLTGGVDKAVIFGVGGAVAGAAIGVIHSFVAKWDGDEAKTYDQTKADYLAFENAFIGTPPTPSKAHAPG